MTVAGDANSDRKHALKVLIVDADWKNVQELAAVLQRRGCETFEATSFEAAKKLWITQRPDMLIADIRLGQFNGLQLLLRARADRPDVTATITSPVPDGVLEAETRKFGGTFLVKPVDPEKLARTMFGARRSVQFDPIVERRATERRHQTIPDFLPDRRLSDRRRLNR